MAATVVDAVETDEEEEEDDDNDDDAVDKTHSITSISITTSCVWHSQPKHFRKPRWKEKEKE